MKFATLALILATTGGVIAVGVPILGRVQSGRNEAARRAQLAAKLRDSTPTQLARANPRWFAAAKAFDKNKATAAAIFDGADKVEALRLFAVASEKPLGQVADNVPFFSRRTVTDTGFAARLGALVLNPKSYALPGQSTTQCYFEPAVALRVWQGQRFADTVICFQCDQLAVLERDPSAPKRSIGGLLTGHFNIAGDFVVRPQLLALTKTAFVGDKAVQKLR